MTAKEYLRQIRTLDLKIKQKQDEYNDLRLSAQGCGGLSYGERVQGGGDSSFTGAVDKYVDLEKEIQGDIERFVSLRHKIIDQICSMDNAKHMDVLYRKYVKYESLEQIAVNMNYVYPYVRQLHGNALSAFGRKFLK